MKDSLFTPTTLSLIGNTPMVRVTAFDTGLAHSTLNWNRKIPADRLKTAWRSR